MALTYSSANTLTISPASLASSSTFLAGRESTEVDNTSDLYLDVMLRGVIRVGTTPTANTMITLFAWGGLESLATTPLDTLDGTDSAETITSAGILQTMFRPAVTLIVDATTSDRDYPFVIRSLATALELPVLPPFWGIFLAHNTGVNLNATGGNHVIKWRGVKF